MSSWLQDDARLFFTLASAADEGMLTYDLAQVWRKMSSIIESDNWTLIHIS